MQRRRRSRDGAALTSAKRCARAAQTARPTPKSEDAHDGGTVWTDAGGRHARASTLRGDSMCASSARAAREACALWSVARKHSDDDAVSSPRASPDQRACGSRLACGGGDVCACVRSGVRADGRPGRAKYHFLEAFQIHSWFNHQCSLSVSTPCTMRSFYPAPLGARRGYRTRRAARAPRSPSSRITLRVAFGFFFVQPLAQRCWHGGCDCYGSAVKSCRGHRRCWT